MKAQDFTRWPGGFTVSLAECSEAPVNEAPPSTVVVAGEGGTDEPDDEECSGDHDHGMDHGEPPHGAPKFAGPASLRDTGRIATKSRGREMRHGARLVD